MPFRFFDGLVFLLLGAFCAGCSTPANADNRPLRPAPQVAFRPPPSLKLPAAAELPAPLRFLVIGDSYVFGKLGSSLDASLRLLPDRKVWMYGSCGSSPLTWLVGIPTPCGVFEHVDGEASRITVAEASPTPQLKQLISTIRPDVTVVVMGTNFLRCPRTTAPDIRKLVDLLEQENTKCVWVGPPELVAKSATPVEREQARQYYEQLYTVLATEPRCKLIDTRKLGVPVEDKTDGYHAGPITAGKLGVAVGREIEAYVASANSAPSGSDPREGNAK